MSENEHKRRQVVLDTETTGLVPEEGHRIIQIAGVELVNRRVTGNDYCQMIDPERESDAEAARIHGITSADLEGKPKFAEEWENLFDYVRDAELVIHNAEFDLEFLDAEVARLGLKSFLEATNCDVIDTLKLARKRFPGSSNNLDALCARFSVNPMARDDAHRADIDAKLLASVYLAMTSGQEALGLTTEVRRRAMEEDWGGEPVPVLRADADELREHETFLEDMKKAAENGGNLP